MESLANNLDLFMILREQLKSLSDSKKLFQFLQHKINVTEKNSAELQTFCTRFCSNVSARWERSSRTLAQFIRKNGDWLEHAINWPEGVIPEAVNTEQERLEICDNEDVENLPPSTTEASTSTFTPRKPFEELGSRQKRRRVEQINKSLSLSPDELKATSIASLRNTGNEDVDKIINHLLKHPDDLEKVKECLSTVKAKNSTYSPDKALSLLVSLKLSKWQYICLREAASENGSDLYPSYYKIQHAKTKCYPGKEDIILSEEGAAIKLQALLNLTVSRLLDVITLDLDSTTELLLISKWGFDGASGQSNYKQKTEAEFDESTIIMASLVPIRLQHIDGTIVWENDRPSSTFYCRPIMFKFIKETQSTVVSIKASITQEIERLHPSRNNQVEVKHQLHMTMIDGKITSYLSETSAAVCDICKAKPSEMNNLESLAQREGNVEIFQYGISSLHAWIRCMECLLHIGKHNFITSYYCPCSISCEMIFM